MEEQLISFETAKLAKEKGFNIPTRNFYADLSWNSKEVYSAIEVGYNEFTNSMEKEHGFGDIILIPTQSLLQKWLREIHEIEVNPAQNFTKGGIKMQYNISIESYKYNHLGKYIYGNTYEEVLEVGLQEGLKLIK